MGLKGIPELHVKVGEEVCYIPGYPAGNWEKNWKIIKVSKVTPTGQIVLATGTRFSNDGYEMSQSHERAVIRELTEETRTRIERAQNIEALRHFNWLEIDAKTANDVITVLKLNGAME